ncbi:RCC1 domain-containing protein [Pseudomonas putida]|uniref:RCC1 domain-containing protein n=1 Tax=Pseudomonas putida TaxID=303 RepID=UPI0023664CF4|nr:hypothetical protein [Pseudomonas putida]MDD2046561.1 hypothetical protein [Pseudomonas putida]
MSSEEALSEDVLPEEGVPEEGSESSLVQGLFAQSGIQQLVELEIPGRTGPVPSGEWGINLAAARDNFPQQGLQLFVPPWPQMDRGDSVAVLLGGTEVTRKPIGDGEAGKRQTLFIAPNRLTNSITTIGYKVTRIGQVPEDSALTSVLINLDRPGGQDQDGSKPGHSELKLSLPQDIINDGVDAATAKKGVPVTLEPYPFMAEHDVIRLTWGGQFVYHTVTQAEVEANTAIVITVDEATILAAGDSENVTAQKLIRKDPQTGQVIDTGETFNNGGLAVAFEVYDLVDNQSEDWSAEVRVVVDTGGSRLAAGIVKEARNNILDLNTLGTNPATLQIIALAENFEELDEVIVTLMGTSADGQPVDISYPPQVVDNVPSVIEIPVPNRDVRRLAKTQAVFRYQLKKAGGALLQAKGRFVSIVGEPVQLAAPQAKDAVGGSLDPQLPMTTIEVPWDETMEEGQTIRLTWQGTRPDLSPYFPEIEPHDISNNDASLKLPIKFIVDGEHLRFLEGGTLQLFYELIDIDGVARKSLVTPQYNVGVPRKELPAPNVKDADIIESDPENLPVSGTRIEVKRYAGIAINDQLHFSWKGSQTGLFTDWIRITKNNFGRDLFTLAISKDKVTDNLNGTVEASYWVVRADDGGRISESDVLTLRVGGQEQQLGPVTVAQEREGQLDLKEVSAGANVTLAVYAGMDTGDVVYLEWTDDQGNEYKPEGTDITSSMVDNPVPFVVPYAEIEKNLNNRVTVICRVELASGTARTEDLSFRVVKSAEPEPELEPVTVDGVAEGSLDLRDVPDGTTATLKDYTGMDAGDVVYLEWTDNKGNSYKPAGKRIDGSMIGKPVVFPVPYAELKKNENNNVTVICRVERVEEGELRTPVLHFTVKESAAPPLPAPTIAEANAEGVIDPNTVTAGATVVIGSEARLLPGDKVRVVVAGKAGDDKTHPVVSVGVQRFKVDYAVIKANENASIELQYHVQRGGSGPAEPSPIAEYDVRVIIGGGQLKILGARFNRSTYRSSGSPRYLQAFDANDLNKALQAEWKYSTDPQWTVANRWRDIQPHLPLQVRTNNDQVTLNPANIIGSGADTTVNGTAAFVAHRDDGRVRGWGNAAFGASIDPTIRTLNDIVEVSCTTSAYAIRRVGGIVTVWGNVTNGGNMGSVSPDGFTTVVANGVAFAGIKTSGQVVAWGVAASGGTVPAPISAYTDIVKVVGASTAFAALRATSQVVAWGAAASGGKVPPEIASLNDIVDIKGNFKAFAALRGNRTVVAWGDAAYGGNAAPVADYADIVEICSANAGAFVVKRESGHVLAWGSAAHGGNLPSGIAGLTDIVDVASNWNVFAAVRANGSVVAWGGTAAEGGVVPDEIADLTNVVQVTGSSKAFAVLCSDGTVKAWGGTTVGGNIAPVLADLVDVQAIYSNTHGFVALRRDGRVVTWGQAAGGGDSSAVRKQLDGFVTYRASSATRGRALNAQRTINAAIEAA